MLLQNLSDEERKRFEKLTTRNAQATSKQYQLYPQIIDNTLINRARVEASLRYAVPIPSNKEDFLSTYYIELTDPENF